jgi:hypothetical protein
MGPEQKNQRKMSVWAVAGLCGRIETLPVLMDTKITHGGDKDLVVKEIPAGSCLPDVVS